MTTSWATAIPWKPKEVPRRRSRQVKAKKKVAMRWWLSYDYESDWFGVSVNTKNPKPMTKCKAILWLTAKDARLMGATKATCGEIEPLRIIPKARSK